ncbi:hypothetical protein Golomagni_05675, partial [Golovinomyces magnicellulatus]
GRGRPQHHPRGQERHHQVAWQAGLCAPPHQGRDRRGQRRGHLQAARPRKGLGPRQASRVAGDAGCVHPPRMCAHRRGGRLWRLVLPLPRLPLRHLWPCPQGSRPAQPRGARVRLQRCREQAHHRLERCIL